MGLHKGMPLADARAICPALIAHEADPEEDARLLDHVAAYCERFTPIVAIDPPDGLFLDVSGCAHLFGGEAPLLETVQAGLRKRGLTARAALAPYPGAAWALAHFGAAAIVASEETVQAALAPLPIAALRLAPGTIALLKRLGLKTIGQIQHAPRAPFTARAGQNAMLRLDQALGRAPEAFSPRRPPPPFSALRRLAEPILTLDAVLIVVRHLCDDLCARLHAAGHGARLLRLSLFGVDGATRAIELGLTIPEQSAAPMQRLLRERLQATAEMLNAEFGFEALRLDALETAPIIMRAIDLAPTANLHDAEALARFQKKCVPHSVENAPDSMFLSNFSDSKIAEIALARLRDRLRARLGESRIGKLSLCATHAPERASAWTVKDTGQDKSKDNASNAICAPQDGVMRRPLTLFPRAQPIEAIAELPDGPPAQFRWRRVMRKVVRAEGPERIAPNWLRTPHGPARDYYRVEDMEGRRYWLYRKGAYGDAEPPRWFLHGLFP